MSTFFYKVKGEASEGYSAVSVEAETKKDADKQIETLYGITGVEVASIQEGTFKKLEDDHTQDLTHAVEAQS